MLALEWYNRVIDMNNTYFFLSLAGFYSTRRLCAGHGAGHRAPRAVGTMETAFSGVHAH